MSVVDINRAVSAARLWVAIEIDGNPAVEAAA